MALNFRPVKVFPMRWMTSLPNDTEQKRYLADQAAPRRGLIAS